MTSRTWAARAAVAVAILLALLCFARAAATATRFHLNPNEEGGITGSVDTSWAALVLGTALPDQINVSPLHYLVDKAWLALVGRLARGIELRVLFRVPALLFFSLYVGILTFLTFRWAESVPLPQGVRLALAAATGLLLQTNYWIYHDVAFRARPYALWFLLTALQLLFLDRALRRGQRSLSAPLAAVGALLSMNSYAAATQAAAVFVARCLGSPGKAGAKVAALEALPALLVGAYYFLHRHYQYLEEYSNLGEFWVDALITAFRLPGVTPLELGRSYAGWTQEGILGIAFALPFFLLPLLAKRGHLPRIYAWALALVLLGIPVTVGAVWLGGYIAPRYFFYLFPAFAVLQLLSVLGLSLLAARVHPKAAWLVAAVWAALLFHYRGPVLAEDYREAGRYTQDVSLSFTPAPGCPESFEQVRSPPVNQIDTARFRALCRGPGKEAP